MKVFNEFAYQTSDEEIKKLIIQIIIHQITQRKNHINNIYLIL